jgi:hypothetical protein
MKRDVALAILGLQGDSSTAAQINEAYRVAMQLNHPDRFVNNEKLRKHAEEQCKLINEAREVLLSRNWQTDNSESGSYNKSWNSAYGTDGNEGNWRQRNNNTHKAYEHERQYSSNRNWHESQYADQKDQDHQQSTGNRSSERLSVTPILDIWKTSIGYSILGVLTLAALMVVVNNSVGVAVAIFGIIQFAYICFQIVYAAVVYPSLFGKKPKLKSTASISFWNCAVGSFIFGPIWNANLTKKSKGASHIVFVIFLVLLMAYWLFVFGYVVAAIQGL